MADVLSEQLVNGRSLPTREDGFPVLRLTALRAVTVDFTQTKGGDWTARNIAPLLAEPGDLLVSRASGSLSLVGEGALVDDPPTPTTFPDTMIRVRVLPTLVNPRYLAHLWNSPVIRRQLETRARRNGGGGIYRISQSDLAEILLPLPAPAEQRRIISLLEHHLAQIDAAETRTRTAVDQADELRRSVIAQACLGRLSNTLATPGNLAPAGTNDGALPSLPADWRWTRLETIADVTRGITKNSRQWEPTDVEVPCLRVANVQRGRLVLDDVRSVRLPIQRAETARLRSGDVVLTGGGDHDKLGRGWIWEDQLPDCVHQNHVFRVRITDQLLHPKLLAWHANGFGRQWCERNATQVTGLASIALRKVRLMPVPVAPAAEQQRLVDFVQAHTVSLETASAAAERALVMADRLRHNLQQQAFSGQLSNAADPFGQQESLL
ncbi:restriction endonuclease subunit S [Sphaerisporangium siamense]|uniref:Type I restriction enzyme S subunit n=1 Tax=Sphaerisporangium siamense TaxID=795645 RepID=A0A7W7G9I8_9ACTN|nr:restriction endonuclease subunit S [Sphaerisporangium siamense]MBB4700645.1 type I restriction enzyme S subunit [Sphaerisporangium siamense]